MFRIKETLYIINPGKHGYEILRQDPRKAEGGDGGEDRFSFMWHFNELEALFTELPDLLPVAGKVAQPDMTAETGKQMQALLAWLEKTAPQALPQLQRNRQLLTDAARSYYGFRTANIQWEKEIPGTSYRMSPLGENGWELIRISEGGREVFERHFIHLSNLLMYLPRLLHTQPPYAELFNRDPVKQYAMVVKDVLRFIDTLELPDEKQVAAKQRQTVSGK